MKRGELEPGACEAAFRAWRSGSGPLLPYVRSTPFVSLSQYTADMELALPSAEVGVLPEAEEGELLVLDLPAARSVAAGLQLWEERALWPVLAMPHWHHPHGIVGDSPTAALLLLRAPAERAEAPAGWCLLLDSGRYREEPLTPDVFNNQYELTEDDLPTAEELRHLGLTGVCLVTDGTPKEDLQRYAAYLAGAQMKVRWAS